MEKLLTIMDRASLKCVDFPKCFRYDCPGKENGCRAFYDFFNDVDTWLKAKLGDA